MAGIEWKIEKKSIISKNFAPRRKNSSVTVVLVVFSTVFLVRL